MGQSLSNKFSLKGLVLLCAPLQRKYRADKNGTFPQIPVLTLGGSDDGLMRITRMAEAFYHGVSQSPTAETEFSHKAVSKSPVIVLEGVNHWQFASGIEPRPYLIRQNVRCHYYNFFHVFQLTLPYKDLTASATLSKARHSISRVISAFLSVQLDSSLELEDVLSYYLGETSKLLTPFIRTLNLEAFKGFKPGCSYLPDAKLDLRSETRDCWVASAWSERAQRYMAGIDEEPLRSLLAEKDGKVGVRYADLFTLIWFLLNKFPTVFKMKSIEFGSIIPCIYQTCLQARSIPIERIQAPQNSFLRQFRNLFTIIWTYWILAFMQSQQLRSAQRCLLANEYMNTFSARLYLLRSWTPMKDARKSML